MQDPDANQFPSLDELSVHAGLHICERCHHQYVDHLPFELLEPVEGLQQSGLYCPTSDEFKQYEETCMTLSSVERTSNFTHMWREAMDARRQRKAQLLEQQRCQTNQT